MRSCDDVAERPPARDADAAVAVLFDTHYRPLTRLATLLAADEAIAEEIVQDAFIAMHAAWRQLRDCDRAVRYLEDRVVWRSRGRQPRGARQPAGEQHASGLPGPILVAALRSLPAPQREALVLRYYADMPEARIASLMRISTRAVNSHISYAMSALHAVLWPG